MFLVELKIEWSLTLQEFYAVPCTIYLFRTHCCQAVLMSLKYCALHACCVIIKLHQ